MKKNQIALIGKGYWGSKLERYIPEYFDLKYIIGKDFDKQKIWDNSEIDSVLIATPIETHYDLVKEALEHDKHVFVEKPITLKYNEGIELKDLAREKGKILAVEYTQTFSKSIKHACKIIKEIGELQYIELSVKHLGRFMNYNVYWLLASHQLSILDMFVDLNHLTFTVEDYMFYKGLCTMGSIIFENRYLKGVIDVSLNSPIKEMQATFYGTTGTIIYNPFDRHSLRLCLYDKKFAALSDELIKEERTYSFDEMNNLRYSIRYFNNVIAKKEVSNIESALKITRILEEKCSPR